MHISNNNQANRPQPFEVPKIVQKAQGVHDKAGMAIEATGNFVDVLDGLTGKVSNSVKQVFGAMAFVGALNIVFAIPSFISNVSKAVLGSSLVERVKSAFRAAADISTAWLGTNAIFMGLKSVGVIGSESFCLDISS